MPVVETAIRYLIATQEDDGSWYGRWGVNYIYGTWQVLRGLRAIGQDMTQDWILRGRAIRAGPARCRKYNSRPNIRTANHHALLKVAVDDPISVLALKL